MKVTVKKKEPEAVKVAIHTDFIKLQDALKYANAVESGGMAKNVIQDELVQVNGEVCAMRGKKLHPGDTFTFQGCTYMIAQYES